MTTSEAAPLKPRPDTGLMLSVSFLLIAVPFAYSASLFDSGLLPKFLALMIGAFLVVRSWMRMELRAETVRTSLLTDLPIFLYVLIVALQWPRAYDINEASLEVTKAFTLAFVYLAITRCSVEAHWRVWTSLLAVVGLVVSIIGICQHLGIAFLSLPSAGFPSATFAYRNIAAMFLITALPFAFLKFVWAGGRRKEVFWAACWTAMFIFLIYTRTRGAWVGWLVSSISVMVLVVYRYGWGLFDPERLLHSMRSSKGVVSLVAVLVIGAASQVGPSAVTSSIPQASPMPPGKESFGEAFGTVIANAGELTAGNIDTGSGRMRFWLATAKLIGDNTWLGIGLTNWDKVYPTYRIPGGSNNRYPRRPHNDYLWIWSELGILGLLAYLGIFVAAGCSVVSLAKHSDLGSFGFGAAAFAGIVAIQGHALFSFPRERVGPLLVEWFCLALLASTHRGRAKHRDAPQPLAVPVLSMVLVVLGATVVIRATVSEAMTGSSVVLLGEGKTEQALQSVAGARKWGLFDYRHLMYQSEVTLASGRTDAAYGICQEVVRRNPNTVNGLQNLGKVAYALENYDISADAYQRAIKVMPSRIGLYRDLGIVYERMGEIGKAIEAYGRARNHDPRAAWIPYKIGDIHYRQDDLETALTYFRDSVALQEGFAPALFGTGNVYLRQGQRDAAVDAYVKGLALDLDNARAHYTLATLYISQGRDSSAVEHLMAALRLTKTDELRSETKVLLERVGRPDGR